ncbi:hypothetical protein AB0B56_17495 [Streptosporangium canum]|uniref:hypothetical protein n=1 Tax=Streptosporangium canum TaxID=324952 RepID=UPI00344845AD
MQSISWYSRDNLSAALDQFSSYEALPDENFLHVFKGGPLRGPPGALVGKRARLRLFGRSGHAPPARPTTAAVHQGVMITHPSSRHTGSSIARSLPSVVPETIEGSFDYG